MENLQKHLNLKIFKQYGFIYQGISGENQVVGRCIFCGSNKKFYINPILKTWDCKVCGRNGGYQKFLQQIINYSQENFTPKRAALLARKRNLSVETLKYHEIGFNPVNETYLIPVWDELKTKIYNIRIYQKDGLLMNSAGCKSALYGWWNIHKPHKIIWLCEGEWDSICMYEILKKNNINDNLVLGVPGANIFNSKWAIYFDNKIVNVIYDNDYNRINKKGVFIPSAGISGMKKVNDILKNVCKDILFIHWPKFFKHKFDLSDFYTYKNKSKRAYKYLKIMLKNNLPAGHGAKNPIKKKTEIDNKENNLYTGEGCSPDQVYSVFRKWLHLPSIDPLDVVFGTIIANRIPGDPVWLFLIGPSGCGKSEIIMSLDESIRIYPVSRITPNTLVSGANSPGGGDPSLIPRIDKHILTIKDFTVILELPDFARDAIFSQLRDAYDNKCSNEFGTGVRRSYDSTFGIIAGVTEIIDMYLERSTAMGERFLSYKFPKLSRYEEDCKIMKMAIVNTLPDNDYTKNDMRKELCEISAKVINYDYKNIPVLSDYYIRKIMALSYWVSKMRGTVIRNKYSREIERKAFIEKPTRISIQLTKFILGLTMFHRKSIVGQEEYFLLCKIAGGSVPEHLNIMIRNIYKRKPKDGYFINNFCSMLRLPHETVERFIENLYQLEILKKVNNNTGNRKQWRLSKKFKEIIKFSEIYEP